MVFGVLTVGPDVRGEEIRLQREETPLSFLVLVKIAKLLAFRGRIVKQVEANPIYYFKEYSATSRSGSLHFTVVQISRTVLKMVKVYHFRILGILENF